MKRKRLMISRAIVTALMALAIACPTLAELNSDGDFQYWDITAIEGKINDRWKASIDAEFRVGDDASKFYYQELVLALNYKVNDWLEAGPGFMQVFELLTQTDEEDDWFTEYRPIVNATVKAKWHDWSLSSRSRFEYRIFDIDKEEAFRYRNRFTLQSPWKWTPLKINPYLSDEIFIQENEAFQTNRFYVGVLIELIAHLKGDLFYLWQTTDKADDWIDHYVIGTKLKLEF